MSTTRRDLVRWSLLSLATGLPVSFLQRGSVAQAAVGPQPTFLILAGSSGGEPLNANCPGSYPVPTDGNDPRWQIEHATTSELGTGVLGEMGGIGYGGADFETGVATTLGNTTAYAARPWADLPESLRSTMAVIRHQTYTNAHPEFPNVWEFHGGVKGPGRIGVESLPAMIGQETAAALGTTLETPISIGRQGYSAMGQPVRKQSPDAIQELFSESGDWRGLSPDAFADYRDAALDSIYRHVATTGTHAQKRFLDAHARSRSDARTLSEALTASLLPVTETDDDVEKQVITAVALIEHRVAPVITISLPFGGDNHQDSDLYTEVTETLQGIEGIRRLHEGLVAKGLQDRATFAYLGVFGRSLDRGGSGGRGHYGADHAMVMFGPHVKAGLYGQVGDDLRAGPIDDVPIEETLAAAGKTLATACGVPDDIVAERIVGGRPL